MVTKNELSIAIENNDYRLVQKYININKNILKFTYGSLKVSILNHTIMSNNAKSNKMLNLLLKNGANPNSKTNEYITPLMIASKIGNYYAVKLLIKFGANVNIRSKKGKTALMLASHKGYYNIVILLLKNGANINIREKKHNKLSCKRKTAKELANECGHKRIVNVLSKKGNKHK